MGERSGTSAPVSTQALPPDGLELQGELRRAFREVEPGNARHLDPLRGKTAVATAVLVERTARPMEGPAVDLDRQARIRPVEVEFVAGQGDALRLRETVLATEAQKQGLRFGDAVTGRLGIGGQDALEPMPPCATGQPLERCL
jgi:hypothetical protein